MTSKSRANETIELGAPLEDTDEIFVMLMITGKDMIDCLSYDKKAPTLRQLINFARRSVAPCGGSIEVAPIPPTKNAEDGNRYLILRNGEPCEFWLYLCR